MNIKVASAFVSAAMFLVMASTPLFAEQSAKGIVTKVSGGAITVKDRHGRLTTVHVKPGDVIAIKVR
ncbi:MAG TPA: hypothetical protein VK452_03000 [Dissulfurispiraceae bacterium]|nr:hypothetical protein [Dissulfurispiraceae bacterium]